MNASPIFKFIYLITFLSLTLASCASTSTTSNDKEETAFKTLQPTIDALEKYKTDRGEYPKALSDLMPKYLEFMPVSFDKHPIEYSNGYVLRFTYSESEVKHKCEYTPTTQWKCQLEH